MAYKKFSEVKKEREERKKIERDEEIIKLRKEEDKTAILMANLDRQEEQRLQKLLREKFPESAKRLNSPMGFKRKLGTDGRVIYSEEERIYTMHQVDIEGDIPIIANVLKIPYGTVVDWVRRGVYKSRDKYNQIKEVLDSIYMNKILEAMDKNLSALRDDKKIDKASLSQCATTFAILVDKAYKISGEPDQVIQSHSVSQIQELRVVLDGIRNDPKQFLELFQANREAKGKLKPPDIE